MAVYQYSDFEKAAKRAGLYNTFSSADLKLAQKNPDAGMSILQYKQDYQNASTDEMRALANAGAERIRTSYGNYSGGEDGSGFHLQNPSAIGYEAAEAPTYTGRYDNRITSALNEVTSMPSFTYNAETDPLYSTYRKQYARLGQRAAEDTLGSVAAASGGLPSSYAVTAASQAGDYYAAQAADKLPELYELAYEQYLDEYQKKLSNLNALQQADQTDYSRYLDSLSQYNTDRAFNYAQYLDEIEQNAADHNTAVNDAKTAASYGDYTALNKLGINTASAEWKDALENAQALASYGDYAALEKLGINTDSLNRSQALKEATSAASYGDYTALKKLGIDTSSAELAQKLETAVTAAKYGDYSQLEALGIDPALARDSDVLARAETAAKYGDFSYLSLLGINAEAAKKKYDAEVEEKVSEVNENPLTQDQMRTLLTYYPDGILPDDVWLSLISTIDGLTPEHLRSAGFQRDSSG